MTDSKKNIMNKHFDLHKYFVGECSRSFFFAMLRETNLAWTKWMDCG